MSWLAKGNLDADVPVTAAAEPHVCRQDGQTQAPPGSRPGPGTAEAGGCQVVDEFFARLSESSLHKGQP